MSTSGVTAWSLTANDIIKASMEEAGIIDPGSDPAADEYTSCQLRLNALLKSWSMRGVTLYRETSSTITTTANVASVTLSAGIRNINSARLVISSTNERMLWPWKRADYYAIPNRAAVGAPTVYYLDRQRAAAVLYLWPVSSSVETIKLDYDRIPETVTAGTQTLDIREEYHETVYANLAVRIAGIFGQQASPELVARAQMLEAQMFDAERPDSYSFEYDCA